MVRRATGLGGVFFRARDPKALQAWYEEHLGLEPSPDGTVLLNWRHASEPDRPGTTVWAPFEADTDYFGAGDRQWMLNYRVDDLQAVLDGLRAEGVTVDERVEESEFGKFGWAVDPEGNRFELWEPPAGH
jgi:predicted enzyme related to lactoylglutathione lyase